MHLFSLLLTALPLVAADPFQVELAARAQSDFDRVDLSTAPTLVDAARCVQSQAAVLPVTAPYSLPLIHFRKGYCALTGALLSNDPRRLADAASDFDQSLAAHAARPRDKKAPPEPPPASVSALAAMARLAAGAGPGALDALDRQLGAARLSATCPAEVMPAQMCREVLLVAAAWQGWIAVRQNRLADAATHFAQAPSPGWATWVEGRRAYENRQYAESAQAFGRAVETWTAVEKNPPHRIPQSLAPPAATAAALVDLGAAQIASNDLRSALATLDKAARRDPNRAWTFFLRGRAREESGDRGGAVADFNLAARTALATQGEEATGEGRFYRGVWSFRRGDADAAEAEFAEALNVGVPAPLAEDAAAWRALAAVSSGGCGVSREKLESAVSKTSPFFPRKEARTALASCANAPARVSEVR